MRYVNIKKVNPGMKIGKDLVDDGGRMLLRKDAILSDNILKILEKKEIQYLYIDDDLTKSVEIEEVIPQYLKNSTIQHLKKLDIDKTITNAKGIVDNILSMQNLSVDVYSSSNDENSLFEHSLAVAQFTVLFANNLGFNQQTLNELAVASLLHDIGKMCGPNPENMDKYDFKSVFNAFNIEMPKEYDDKYHPLYGYAMLKDNVMLDSVIRNSILRHHESIDNTGIKYKRSDSLESANNPAGKATQFAKIINIADTFVRLMSNTYAEAKVSSITEAVEYLKAYGGTKFDKEYTEKFLENMPIFPKGLMVDLSNGMQATIAESNKGAPTRPKVIIDGRQGVIDLTDLRLQSLLISNILGSDYDITEKHL